MFLFDFNFTVDILAIDELSWTLITMSFWQSYVNYNYCVIDYSGSAVPSTLCGYNVHRRYICPALLWIIIFRHVVKFTVSEICIKGVAISLMCNITVVFMQFVFHRYILVVCLLNIYLYVTYCKYYDIFIWHIYT